MITLEQLDLNTNRLTGTLSTNIGNLVNLQLLQVFENLMTGTIPTELGNVGSLLVGEFYNNTFTGTMPTEVCDNVAPAGAITALTSDCDGPAFEIVCLCCTGCASD